MLSHFGIIQKMVKSEQCNDTVRLSAINCLTEMSNLCAMEKSFLTLTKLQGMIVVAKELVLYDCYSELNALTFGISNRERFAYSNLVLDLITC